MPQRKSFTSLLVVTVLALSCAVFAERTKVIESGETTVALSGNFLSALESLGVTPGVVSPTQLNVTTVNFPITGGTIDLVTAGGNLIHSGGLTLSAGGTVIRIESFIIDTTAKVPVITGLVIANGALVGRLPLFDLVFKKHFNLPVYQNNSVLIDLSDIDLKLDAVAAGALNQVFNTTALKGGFLVGKGRVRAFTNGWIPKK